MSHRKASKRRREPERNEDFSPSFLPQTKRSKSGEGDEKVVERNESPLHTLQDTDAGVRRSSRPPKPKVFDDEETAVIGRTVETSSSSKPGDSGLTPSILQPSTISKRITPKNEPSIAGKQKKSTPTVSYDEGHKRETRRSYQNYLEELKTEIDPFETTGVEIECAEHTTSKNQQRSRERKVTQRRKSDVTSPVVESTTPKTTGVMQKKEKGTSNSRNKRETPEELSPKVRTSSRTPVPKRIFSLLQEEKKAEQKSEEPGTPQLENELVNSSSPKARSSSRPHVPKKEFPLLEKEDRKEEKQDVPELTSSKTRTPKSQSTKRKLSTESSVDRNLSKSTPVTGDEPSSKVRVSSRGHKPKRIFSLLEGDEGFAKNEEGSNPSEKIYGQEMFALANQIEQQKSTTAKEPKRRKSNSVQQFSELQSSAMKGLKLSSSQGKEKSDSVVVKVEGSDVGKYISTETVVSENMAAVISPVSESSQSTGSKDDQGKGRLNKRKGKPVKKKVATSQEAQMSMVGVPDVKVKVEPELSAGYETLISANTITTKLSNKKKQSQSFGANVVKQEGVENSEGFSLSDIARGVIDSSTASSDLDTSVSKGKRKGKLSKDTKQKANKDKSEALNESKEATSNSDSKTEEHEHIILKLQLPPSEDSTKHKKHHHHHHHRHHHHHKHKHSSGSHEDGSPKKSHHKKSAAKLPNESSDLGGNKEAVITKKKKISIKFKGLLNNEMASNDLKQSNSAGLESTEKQSNESGKKKKKPKKGISHDEEQLQPSSQSEGERVRLVIKKDNIPTDKKSGDVKTKKVSKPTASASANKKKTSLATKSKKRKGSSSPSKRTKSPQVFNNNNNLY